MGQDFICSMVSKYPDSPTKMGQSIEWFSLPRGPEWNSMEVAFLQGPGIWAVCAIYSGRVPDCGS